ncbi:hypothetical protein GGI17_002480 [Coemansia sp. S146]|nr:hypothetical protein GGI17_002480 [Coemansia sp. S146]
MSAQPNSVANPNGGGATWQSSITEQVRQANLHQICAAILQSQTEPNRTTILNSMYQFESDTFATARSSQEYVTLLNGRVAAIAQKLQMLQAAQALAQQQQPAAAATNPAISMLQNPQFSIPTAAAPTPPVAHAQPPAANNPQPLTFDKVQDIIQSPDNYSLLEIGQAIQLLQSQLHTNKPGLAVVIKRLLIEYQNRSRQTQQQQQQSQAQQQQQQVPAQAQVAMRQQQHQQQQQQPPQQHPQAAAANSQPVRPPGDSSHPTTEDFQMWKQALAKVLRPFTYNGTTLNLDMASAYAIHSQLVARGDTQNAAVLTSIIQDIVLTCSRELGQQLTKEMAHLILQDSPHHNAATGHPAPSQAPAAPAPDSRITPTMSNAAHPPPAAMQGNMTSPAMAMGAVPGVQAQQPQAPPAAMSRKSVSGKSSPSVANAKPKKKSQSPRTATKARKATPPKATTAALTAALAEQQQQQQQHRPDAAPSIALPNMTRSDSISTETATKVVAEIIGSMDDESIKRGPRMQLSDVEKKNVRGNLSTLEQFLDILSKLLPVIYMGTRDQGSIRKIHTIDVLVKEQRRLFDEDQYIVSPAHMNSLYEILLPFLTIAKEWGHTQQQGPPAVTDASLNRAQAPAHNAAASTQPAGQPTPLTNMHPGSTTNDPELEGFQRAVKHPLDPDSLRLPPTKKRATPKNSVSSNDGGGLMTAAQAMAPPVAGQPHLMQLGQHAMQQHAPTSFAPAPMVLPANMSKEQFDRLPFETRAAILQSQQSALIRQNSMGMGPVSHVAPSAQQQQQQQQIMGAAQSTNPLLLAAVQGISAHSAQSAEEQRLKVLEQDKWNNPLEYLMCVLGKFTKSAERAGVEPSPILQQAFWPIARKSMSSGWGVVAADAVL